MKKLFLLVTICVVAKNTIMLHGKTSTIYRTIAPLNQHLPINYFQVKYKKMKLTKNALPLPLKVRVLLNECSPQEVFHH